MLKRLSKNAKITLSILLILLGVGLILFNYFESIKHNVFNYQNIKLMEQQIRLEEELEEIIVPDIVNEEPTTTKVEYDKLDNYIGYLSVPDANIKRGFVSMDSKYNSVKYNVMLIEGSTMPDVEKGNLILAAHRGNSSVSFFDKLLNVSIGSYAYVTYNNRVYKYELKNTYDEPKDGMLTIKRNADASCLTLITCNKTDKKTQKIFNYELVSVSREE